MSPIGPTVLIVDDDASMRKSLKRLCTSLGLRSETFASADEFLERRGRRRGCLVLDVRMPGLSGMDLQARLVKEGAPVPIVFITGHGDIPLSVRAMKAGAVDFLPKPFDKQELLDAIHRAIRRCEAARRDLAERRKAQRRFERLTPREQDVLRLVIAGLLNKQIGLKLGISEKTVKVHRGRVMQTMGAGSVADLVRLADKAGVQPSQD